MTNVIIDDVLPRSQFTATAGQTVFDTNWTVDATTDVIVYARADGVAADDATQLVSSVDYNVTLVGAQETVRVTFLSGRTLDDIITIIRATPYDRQNIYTNTNFTPSMLNSDIGRTTLWVQQNQLDRGSQNGVGIRYNYSEELTLPRDQILPILEGEQTWVMNAARTAIVAADFPEGGAAPKDETYIVQVADAGVPNAQALGDLSTGIMASTTTTGVVNTCTLMGTANQITIANGTGVGGDPTFAIATNPTIPGTGYIIPPSGTTAQRPGTPSAGMVRFNTDTNSLEVYEGSSWDGLSGGVVDSVVGTANEIDVDNTDAANPVLSLSATVDLSGTFNIQSSTAVDSILDEDDMASDSDTALATQQSIKAYVDSRTDLHYMEAVLAASTADFTSTYDNGTSGVGATLTASSNGAFSLDGEAGVLNGRYLMKDQSTTYENGIYTLTQVGDGSNPAILTRATDFDEPSEIDPGDIVPVLNGTVNGSTAWIQTATVNTIGTDAITFSQWTADLSNVVTIDGTQTITGSKTLNLFSGTMDGDIDMNGNSLDGGDLGANTAITSAQIDNININGNSISSTTGAVTIDPTSGQPFTANVIGGAGIDFNFTGAGDFDVNLGSGLFVIDGTTGVNSVLDEDDMASDSATALATQQSIKAYVDSFVPTSNVVQSQITTITTGSSTSSSIPFDNTIPQITEGAQFTSVTITPTDASNILVIEVFIPIITVSTQGSVVFQSAIFQSPTADALCSSYGGTYNQNHTLQYQQAAGTTSAITFTFRFGTAGSGTVYCNQASGGVVYGGSNVAFMKVTEYKV